MRALVACERSGSVRRALRAVGVDAWSCDLVPADDGDRHHITGDALDVLGERWDLLVAHPPCTYLSRVAAACLDGRCGHPHRHTPVGALRRQLCIDAALFFRRFLDAGHIPLRAVENPAPHRMAGRLMGLHQGVSEPWHHGDAWMKRTFWWLRGLQPLAPTAVVEPAAYLVGGQRNSGRLPQITSGGTPEDTLARSVTSPGTAAAIAAQWTRPASLF
ncbi:MAG: hypothetical protein F4Z29_00840 [Gemmatimonadetes bacterium]|nr:hypothetical protein [Gemmatimonadota bacterium]